MGPDWKSRTPIVVLSAVAAAMVGTILTAISQPDPANPDPATHDPVVEPTVPADVAGPTTEEPGAPVMFEHDEDGATAAALAYASAPQQWLYLTDEEIAAAVQEIAAPAAGPRLADEVVADVSAARQRLGTSPGRVWWLVRPMAWRVESFRTDEATVAVWTVTVLSAEEVASPQTEWVTVTVDLAWVDGDWRVDDVRDSPGPTPMTGPNDQPWNAVPFDDALAGFTRLDGEPLS